jgi:hypothetical protein
MSDDPSPDKIIARLRTPAPDVLRQTLREVAANCIERQQIEIERLQARFRDLTDMKADQEAEIERLQAALREIKTMPAIERTDYRLMEIIDAALAGKGET